MLLRGGAKVKDDEDVDDDEEDESDDEDEEEAGEESEEEADQEEAEYDEEEEGAYDDEEEEEESVGVSDAEEDDDGGIQIDVQVEKYDDPLVPSPFTNLFATFGVMMLSRKVDLFHPTVVRIARYVFFSFSTHCD